MTKRAAAALLFAAAGHGAVAGQERPAPVRQPYSSTVTAIVVDVVVRDRRGVPVTDLTSADLELFEDGVRQKIDTFTQVSRGSGIGVCVAWKSPDRTVVPSPGTSAAASETATAAQEESTVALVFDHLSSDTLRYAQRATLDYVPAIGEVRARVGVFANGAGIHVLQRYTTDLTRVREAVARVTPAGTAALEQKTERTDQLIARRRELQGAVEEAATGVVAGAGAVIAANAAELGRRESELRMVQTELNMIRSFDNLDRDHKGYDTALGLLTVVQSLAVYPGRKTIVFFSEGLPVSPALSARLDYVIDLANRANITAYAVDASGLRAKSTATNLQREVNALAEERLTQVASGGDRTEQPLTMAFERVEDTLKLDSRTGLARLAEDTGGFLFEQSNNLSAAFRRIDEDNRFHYLVTYSPSNANFDGKFRSIRVRVTRPGMQVFARKGYRAVPAPGVDTGSYDAAALALLDRSPIPNAFPIHAAGFTFPEQTRPGLTPIVVKVKTDALRFTIDERRGTYAAQAAIVVRIRDGRGDEIQKLSQQYLLAGEAKDLDAARNGEIIFYREADLPAGIHTMEAIVFDSVGRQGSARISTLSVPEAQPAGVVMSSLVLVTRIERVDAAPVSAAAPAPLYVGRTLLYPNVGEPVRRAAGTELPFYFAVYGDRRGMKADVQLLRSGQVIAESPLELPMSTGPRVQHVGRLPIGNLPNGTYELRIRLTDGRREQSRTAYFTLRD